MISKPALHLGTVENTTNFLQIICKRVSKPHQAHMESTFISGEMPEGINKSIIIPIHKGGMKGEPSNYRPVALITFDKDFQTCS